MQFNTDELTKLTNFMDKKFNSIDKVIAEVKRDKDALQSEVKEIEQAKQYDLKSVKRKPKALQELGEVINALQDLEIERARIFEESESEISYLASNVYMSLTNETRVLVNELEKELKAHLASAGEIVEKINAQQLEKDNYYNSNVIRYLREKLKQSNYDVLSFTRKKDITDYV